MYALLIRALPATRNHRRWCPKLNTSWSPPPHHPGDQDFGLHLDAKQPHPLTVISRGHFNTYKRELP